MPEPTDRNETRRRIMELIGVYGTKPLMERVLVVLSARGIDWREAPGRVSAMGETDWNALLDEAMP